MDEYIGMIKIFAGNFAPRGWALCNGQLLPVNQYQAVFAILGVTYGGNGTTNFAVPNLCSRVPLGTGQGIGLSTYQLGQTAGVEAVTLTINNLPTHTHALTGSIKIPVNDSNADADNPTGAYLGTPAESIYSSSQNSFAADPVSTLANSVTGANLPISVQQPVLALNYIICLEGLFPSRN